MLNYYKNTDHGYSIVISFWHIQLNLVDSNTVKPIYSVFRSVLSGPVFILLILIKK